MSDEIPKLLNLTEYNKQRRSRESYQNGHVKLVGKREKKWRGYYNVWIPEPSPGHWNKRKIILGTKVEIPTKAQAEDRLREWLRQRNNQPAATTSQATFRALAEDFFSLNKGNWGTEWQATMRGMYDNVLFPAFGARPIDSIPAEELVRFINQLPEREWRTTRWVKKNGVMQRGENGKLHTGISESYVKKIKNKLRGIFGLAVYKGLITVNPADDFFLKLRMPVQAKAPDKSMLPPGELLRLLDKMDARDTLITWICMLGGPRPNELFALFGRSVGVDRLYVENALDRKRQFKRTKSKKPREVFLPPMLCEELKHWIKINGVGPDDLVFKTRDGRPLNRSNILKRRLRKAAECAGIETLDVDFQMLRRSFTSAFIAMGGDLKSAQSQLGHAQPDTTLIEYQQTFDAHRAAVLAKVERAFRGKDQWPEEVLGKLAAKQGAARLIQ